MEKTKLLENLRITIEQDPSYFASAKANLSKTDGVNELLDKIKKEAKTRAETAIAEVKTVFLRTPEIEAKAQKAFKKLRAISVTTAHFEYEKSKRKHKLAEKLLEDAIIKVESGEYEAILKAKSVAEEAKKTVIESHRLVDSAINIAIKDEHQTIDKEKRAKAAEVERLRLKKIQDENAIITAKVAAKAARTKRISKLVRAIIEAPVGIIVYTIACIIILFVGWIVLGIILYILGYNDNKQAETIYRGLLWAIIPAGIVIGLFVTINEFKNSLK